MLAWEPLALESAQLRLDTILKSWEGTPYRPGQKRRGSGVDCVRFVCSVMDEWLRVVVPRDSSPTLPQDASLHNRTASLTAMRLFLERWRPWGHVEGGALQPGDVLVIGPKLGGPGHAMIVGCQPNVLWHSNQPCVTRTSFGVVDRFRLFQTYRSGARERAA